MDNFGELAPFLWIEEGQGQASSAFGRKRRYTKKKKEFVGWGSKQLIGFLQSVGKETDKVLSQHDITNVINQYINDRKLIHPEKKKKVICDERLLALFGRKSINRVKIHDLLEAHLAENQVNSDDDLFYSSEEREEDAGSVGKRQRISTLDIKTPPKKKLEEVSKHCLAAISPENIKLVYLKRSLVQELLKDPGTFESKVVGSFVRIKSDPLDIFQKNSHQLQLVLGVKGVAAAGDRSSCTLQISGTTDDVSISALSDDNFSEEECEDLRQRVKDGLLKQPTVGELELKVGVLHEDITKHWLTRELALLKNLIDRANEKGWRHRVAEYLDRRKLLQTPSEQSRLLSEIPKVKAEEVKPEAIPEDPPDGADHRADDSPKVADWDWEPCDLPANGVVTNISNNQDDQDGANQRDDDSPKAADWDWEPCYFPAKEVMTNGSIKQDGQVEIDTRSNGHAQSLSPEEGGFLETQATRAESNGHHTQSLEQNRVDFPTTEASRPEGNGITKPINQDHQNFPSTQINPSSSKEREISGTKNNTVGNHQVEVIDLSDDEEEEQEVPCGRQQMINPLPDLLMWHYVDPRGIVQGPFSLRSLKKWSDLKFFPADFRVWRNDQSPWESVLLSAVLQQIFPS